MIRSRALKPTSQTDLEVLRLRVFRAAERAERLSGRLTNCVWSEIESLAARDWFKPRPPNASLLLETALRNSNCFSSSSSARTSVTERSLPLWKYCMIRAVPSSADPYMEQLDEAIYGGFYREAASLTAKYIADCELKKLGRAPARHEQSAVESYLTEIFTYRLLCHFEGLRNSRRYESLISVSPLIELAEKGVGLPCYEYSGKGPTFCVIEPDIDHVRDADDAYYISGWGVVRRRSLAAGARPVVSSGAATGWVTLRQIHDEKNGNIRTAMLNHAKNDSWYLLSDIEGAWHCVNEYADVNNRRQLIRTLLLSGADRDFRNSMRHAITQEDDSSIRRMIYQFAGDEYFRREPLSLWKAVAAEQDGQLLSELASRARALEIVKLAPEGVWEALQVAGEIADFRIPANRNSISRQTTREPRRPRFQSGAGILSQLGNEDLLNVIEGTNPSALGRSARTDMIISLYGVERFFKDSILVWTGVLTQLQSGARVHLIEELLSRQIDCPRTPGMMRKLLDAILREPNLTARQKLLELIDHHFLIDYLRARITDRQGEYTLYEVPAIGSPPLDSDPFALIRCICPSTGNEYFLRVPSGLPNARAAVAWTFGESEDTYRPAMET